MPKQYSGFYRTHEIIQGSVLKLLIERACRAILTVVITGVMLVSQADDWGNV